MDASLDEEMCMAARLSVTINKLGRVCAIQKGGVGGFDTAVLGQMIKTASNIAKILLEQIDVALARENSVNAPPKIGFFAQ